MADFGITEALAIASLAAAAAGTAATMSQAAQQRRQDQAAYDQNVQIAFKNAQTSQDATNQVETQAEQKTVQDTSARLMRADQQLGTLRTTASAAGTSSGTYNALMQQETYSEGSDLNTIQRQYGATITSAEEDKQQARVDYSNAVATAGTQLQGAVARDNAASTSALLSGIGSGLSIGANYENRMTQQKASTDAFNNAMNAERLRRTN